ncbi:MAG: polysaccharide deacetylase family protein [Oricola sp.]
MCARLLPALMCLGLLAGCSTDTAPKKFHADSGAGGPEIAAAFIRPDRRVMDGLIPSPGRLAGRTIAVSNIYDIQLKPREVVLTFDDGPVPGRTDSILDTLDRFGVKATFLMVGQMAHRNPQLVRKVAARGHSIGNHTWGHPNLAHMSFDKAVAEIDRGEKAIRDAGAGPIKFFRFPYLADSGRLRAYMASRGVVVLDVDIDSKDYFKSAPTQVAARTMSGLHRMGGGIVLFHDLQPRTAAMLPNFLLQLKREGYSVVRIVPGRSPLRVASAE